LGAVNVVEKTPNVLLVVLFGLMLIQDEPGPSPGHPE
jgi:hypothetical protein